MTRTEHMNWAKARAIEYVDAGKVSEAFASMASDLSKHTETADHKAIEIGTLMLLIGMLNSEQEMRNFINSFN